MPDCKSIKDKLRRRTGATFLRRRRLFSQEISSTVLDREDGPSSSGDFTPIQPAESRIDNPSSESVNNPRLSTSSPMELPLGLSWDTTTTRVATPCSSTGLDLPRQNGQGQHSIWSGSTISVPLSENYTLVQIRTEEQPLLGYTGFSEPAVPGEDGLRSAWSDWSSDVPETNAEERVKKPRAKRVMKAIRTYYRELPLNPFRRRPQHLKPALVRFPLD